MSHSHLLVAKHDTIITQGRLYLEELQKKDLTSCLKNDKVRQTDDRSINQSISRPIDMHPYTSKSPRQQFLDFFFSQVRRNDTGLHPTYPFVSPCGREMNYILPADMPIGAFGTHFLTPIHKALLLNLY